LRSVSCPGREGFPGWRWSKVLGNALNMTASRDGYEIRLPLPDAFTLDPSPTWAWLRQEAPVTRARTATGHPVWLVTRYADVKTVLSDPRFSRAAVVRPGAPFPAATPPRPGTLMALDPPEHSRLRALVSPTFTRRRVEQLRPWIRQLAEKYADQLLAAGEPADLVRWFARPFPLEVMCVILGVPDRQRDDLRRWTDVVYSLNAADAEPAGAAYDAMEDYFRDLVRAKRERLATPGVQPEDLLDELILARDGADRLSETELIGLSTSLLAAGHETTANQIGCFVVELLRDPARWERLRREPDLVPAAVEELLRFNRLSETGQLRIAVADVELSGQTIRTGEAVMASVGAANRDPERFDDPDTLRWDRKDNAHLTFGYGVHYCLGAHLARVELAEALLTLFDRLPAPRLAIPAEQIQWRRTVLRGPVEVPLYWSADAPGR